MKLERKQRFQLPLLHSTSAPKCRGSGQQQGFIILPRGLELGGSHASGGAAPHALLPSPRQDVGVLRASSQESPVHSRGAAVDDSLTSHRCHFLCITAPSRVEQREPRPHLSMGAAPCIMGHGRARGHVGKQDLLEGSTPSDCKPPTPKSPAPTSVLNVRPEKPPSRHLVCVPQATQTPFLSVRG